MINRLSVTMVTRPLPLFTMMFCMIGAGLLTQHAYSAEPGPPGIYDVRDYGAVGDGKTVNTTAIQATIDACAAAGGGKVYLADGRYVSGTIRLKSNIALYIEAGATLMGSPHLSDYPEITPAFKSDAVNYCLRSLIYAEKAGRISILGEGTIDGQGQNFFTPEQSWPRRYMERPGLFVPSSARA